MTGISEDDGDGVCVGWMLGWWDGEDEKICNGDWEGDAVGFCVGFCDGELDGAWEGDEVGSCVGYFVGSCVGGGDMPGKEKIVWKEKIRKYGEIFAQSMKLIIK